MRVLFTAAALAAAIAAGPLYAQSNDGAQQAGGAASPKPGAGDRSDQTAQPTGVTPNSARAGNTAASGPSGDTGSFNDAKIYDTVGGGDVHASTGEPQAGPPETGASSGYGGAQGSAAAKPNANGK